MKKVGKVGQNGEKREQIGKEKWKIGKGSFTLPPPPANGKGLATLL